MGSRFNTGQGDLFSGRGRSISTNVPASIDTLTQAKQDLEAKLDEGTVCPCCGKYTRRYRRKFNSSMARSLIWLYRESTENGMHDPRWVDVPNTAPKWLLRTNQLPTVRWWGFIERRPADNEQKHSGLWRPTKTGIGFVKRAHFAASAVVTYNGEPVRFEGDSILIDDALGRNFSYVELMGWD